MHHVAVGDEREPHELFPAMPPNVAWALVETSTGKPQPVLFELRVELVQDDTGLDDRRACDTGRRAGSAGNAC